jgi:hypothetical protein
LSRNCGSFQIRRAVQEPRAEIISGSSAPSRTWNVRMSISRCHNRKPGQAKSRTSSEDVLFTLAGVLKQLTAPDQTSVLPVRYHYTTLEGAARILQSQRLGATTHHCTNDAAEIRAADHIIFEVVEKFRPTTNGYLRGDRGYISRALLKSDTSTTPGHISFAKFQSPAEPRTYVRDGAVISGLLLPLHTSLQLCLADQSASSRTHGCGHLSYSQSF